jgi:hypothetical protein
LPVIERHDGGNQLGEAQVLRAEMRLQAGDRTGARADVATALPLLTGFGADQDSARERARALATKLGMGNRRS